MKIGYDFVMMNMIAEKKKAEKKKAEKPGLLVIGVT